MKFLKTLVLLSIILSVGEALALDKKNYSDTLFEQLSQGNDVVVVDVYASWCPTCQKQQRALEAYRKANPDKKIHVLNIDFDDNKAAVRKFRAPRQSTLLVYKGGKQFWFSVGEHRPDVIAKELDKAHSFKLKKVF